MIEKFNFYDVYGYFLPGVALLAILWAPFGLISGKLPSSDWSSALIVVAIAYFLGHLLQNIATNAIPSQQKIKPKQTQASTPSETGQSEKEVAFDLERLRYPSDYFLDKDNFEFPEEVKKKIADFAEPQFGIDLELDKTGDWKIDKVRNNAFFLARQILIQGDAVSYAEQFQGMYALTRGLFAVFGLACFYWAGWFFAATRNKWFIEAAIFLFAMLLTLLMTSSMVKSVTDMISEKKIPKEYEPQFKLYKYRFELFYAGCLALLFLSIGYLVGIRNFVQWRDGVTLAFFSVGALLACFRFKGMYDYFAKKFASTVWRDYLAYNVKAKEASETKSRTEDQWQK